MNLIKKYKWFIAVFCVLLLSLFLMEQTKTRIPKEDCSVMLEAAKRAEAAFAAIKEEKTARGYSISPVDDPNQTGMIGESYTEITTTLGSLESKRSAANPNNAAMLVDMMIQCGVKSGDPVAVNLSSSFPGLNTAVLCALDAIGAKGIIMNSVGASTYGANLPDFTWLDMEEVLLDRGLISNHSQWFSMGGAGDIGKEMPDEVKEAIISRHTKRGLTFLHYEDLAENLTARRAIYAKQCKAISGEASPVCFINAGGNLLSFGGGTEMVSAHNGIIRPGTIRPNSVSEKEKSGLIPLFSQDRVPVIHLLNMKTLLPAYGLPFDPSPMPAAGEGDVYMKWHYNVPFSCILLAASLFLFYQAVRRHPRRKIPL